MEPLFIGLLFYSWLRSPLTPLISGTYRSKQGPLLELLSKIVSSFPYFGTIKSGTNIYRFTDAGDCPASRYFSDCQHHLDHPCTMRRFLFGSRAQEVSGEEGYRQRTEVSLQCCCSTFYHFQKTNKTLQFYSKLQQSADMVQMS